MVSAFDMSIYNINLRRSRDCFLTTIVFPWFLLFVFVTKIHYYADKHNVNIKSVHLEE